MKFLTEAIDHLLDENNTKYIYAEVMKCNLVHTKYMMFFSNMNLKAPNVTISIYSYYSLTLEQNRVLISYKSGPVAKINYNSTEDVLFQLSLIYDIDNINSTTLGLLKTIYDTYHYRNIPKIP